MAHDIVSPVRWVGGKRALAPQIMERFPGAIGTYAEPFLGGGSIFLEALGRGMAARYVVGDINRHVVDMWSDIRDDYPRLLDEMLSLKDSYDRLPDMESRRERYYEFRRAFDAFAPGVPTFRQSAMFMTLNKTAFNALVRYNSKGCFNSAFGKRDTVRMDFDNLEKLHHALHVDVEFVHGDFTAIEDVVGGWSPGDFVYLDPPYHVLGDRKVDDKTYSKDGFADKDELRLRAFCDRIAASGAGFLMSNHDCPEILRCFEGYSYEKISCYKSFTGKASSRIETGEILMGVVSQSNCDTTDLCSALAADLVKIDDFDCGNADAAVGDPLEIHGLSMGFETHRDGLTTIHDDNDNVASIGHDGFPRAIQCSLDFLGFRNIAVLG